MNMSVTLAPEVLIFDGGVHATWLLVDRLRRGIVPVVCLVNSGDGMAPELDVLSTLAANTLLPQLSELNAIGNLPAEYNPYLTPFSQLSGVVGLIFSNEYSVPFEQHTLTLPTMVLSESDRLAILKYTLTSTYHDAITAYDIVVPFDERYTLPTLDVVVHEYTELEPLYQQLVFWVPAAAKLAREIDRKRGLDLFYMEDLKPATTKGKSLGRVPRRR
jgi:hypothetical protein